MAVMQHEDFPKIYRWNAEKDWGFWSPREGLERIKTDFAVSSTRRSLSCWLRMGSYQGRITGEGLDLTGRKDHRRWKWLGCSQLLSIHQV